MSILRVDAILLQLTLNEFLLLVEKAAWPRDRFAFSDDF